LKSSGKKEAKIRGWLLQIEKNVGSLRPGVFHTEKFGFGHILGRMKIRKFLELDGVGQ
jgi:hypothetical protein